MPTLEVGLRAVSEGVLLGPAPVEGGDGLRESCCDLASAETSAAPMGHSAAWMVLQWSKLG